MLNKLIISNFALIKELEIEFGNGMNVVSGETGSGKSLIMKALKFVLGDRADKSYIRDGENSTKVQCVFSNISKQICEMLEYMGTNIESDKTIIISRVMSLDGRNDIRINGDLCTLGSLNKITKLLTDFYGQQEHYSLLEQSKQNEIVDSFNNEKILPLKKRLQNLLAEKNDLGNKLKQNFGNENDKKFKIELLEYEINELGEDVFNDEDEELLKEKRIKFQSMEKINASIENIKSLLNYSVSNSSIANAFKSVAFELRSIEKFDKGTSLIEECDNLRYAIEDFNAKIEDFASSLCDENIDIDDIESKLDTIKSLKRKYGNTKNERLQYLQNARDELDFILNNEKVINDINEKLNNMNREIMQICRELFEERESTIAKIENGIIANLRDLDMKNAQFKIAHSFNDDIDKVTFFGLDSIEFKFSSNLGQPLKPLAKIISGGELSRFMLAYKNVVMLRDSVDLLIFDEIDSGISGAVGQKVATKINSISKSCQVISISHLPQIVSIADNNLVVYKQSDGKNTFTKVENVTGEKLLREIARLSGSKDFKDIDLKFAKELYDNASRLKSINNNCNT